MVRKIVLLLPLFISINLIAQHVIEVNDSIDQRDFMPNELTYYIDTTNTLSFWQISQHSFSNRFHKHEQYLARLYSHGAVQCYRYEWLALCSFPPSQFAAPSQNTIKTGQGRGQRH